MAFFLNILTLILSLVPTVERFLHYIFVQLCTAVKRKRRVLRTIFLGGGQYLVETQVEFPLHFLVQNSVIIALRKSEEENIWHFLPLEHEASSDSKKRDCKKEGI